MAQLENTSWKVLLSSYPAASAFLLAQKLSHSANEQMAQVGSQAMEMIANGNDYMAALSEMKQFITL